MPAPADWEPPYPAFSAAFAPDVRHVAMAYYAVQDRGQGHRERAAFTRWLLNAARTASPGNGPDVINRARHVGRDSVTDHVFILYWTDPARFSRWDGAPMVRDWWLAPERMTEAAGYWREVWQPPLDHLETLISSHEPAGLAEAHAAIDGPVRAHAYWGAARDRIPRAANDPLDPTFPDRLPIRDTTAGPDARLRISLPGNLCLIRSGQNWADCGPEELGLYKDDVEPVLIRGMDYLRDTPVETGCLSCRFMDQVTVDGDGEHKTFATACFLSLGHLEAWARSHPTHLAIFDAFHELVKKRNFAPDLKLWHEIAVMPDGTGQAEYINCAPGTGFLPWFGSQRF